MGIAPIAHIRTDRKGREVQSLCEHLNQTAAICGDFAKKFDLEKTGRILGALHDFGKASDEFQNYIRSAEGLIDPDSDDYVDEREKKGKIDHSSAGAQFLREQLEQFGPEGSIAAQVMSLCIASHHSGLIDCLTPDGTDNLTRRLCKPDHKTHLGEVKEKMRAFQGTIDPLQIKALIQELVLKMSCMRESLDDNSSLAFKHGLLVRSLFSCLIDADRLDSADFEKPRNRRQRHYGQYKPWSQLIERLNQKYHEFERKSDKNYVDEIRRKVASACLASATKEKGIFELTVPTGGGKTLASLRFALHHADKHGMERIFYILPYTSIIDQNASEVRKILEPEPAQGDQKDFVVLEHHSNLTPDVENYRQALLAEDWDAPIVFTTQVQFLEALFGSGTRGARRMHQLANSVIIFDEIQTLPVRCIHLFNIAIRFLVHDCNASVVLCTATQPLLDQVQPSSRSLQIADDHKIIPNEKELFAQLRRVEAHDKRKVGGWREEEIVELALREMEKTDSALVIVNTRKAARSIFEKVNAAQKGKTYHLSTNMCAAHRLCELNEIRAGLESHVPLVCVSTQLIEAGVDVDFGSVIRTLAGFDRITQAAGRCNRNGHRERGNVWIVNPDFENLERLKEIRIGADNAMRILDEFQKTPDRFEDDLLGLESMRQFFEYYFYARKAEMAYPTDTRSAIGRNDDLFNLLAQNLLSDDAYRRVHKQNPNLLLKQSFMSAAKSFRAIETSTRGVITTYGEGKEIITDLCRAFAIERQVGLLRKSQRFTINMFPNEFQAMAEIGGIHETQAGSGIYALQKAHYDEQFGWSADEVSNMEFLMN